MKKGKSRMPNREWKLCNACSSFAQVIPGNGYCRARHEAMTPDTAKSICPHFKFWDGLYPVIRVVPPNDHEGGGQ